MVETGRRGDHPQDGEQRSDASGMRDIDRPAQQWDSLRHPEPGVMGRVMEADAASRRGLIQASRLFGRGEQLIDSWIFPDLIPSDLRTHDRTAHRIRWLGPGCSRRHAFTGCGWTVPASVRGADINFTLIVNRPRTFWPGVYAHAHCVPAIYRHCGTAEEPTHQEYCGNQ